MVTLTYKDLNDPNFMAGLKQLVNERLPLPISYQVLKITNAVEKEMQVASELYRNIIKKYCKLDDKGNIAFKDGVPGQFELIEESKEAFDKEFVEWSKIELKIERPKLPMASLEACGVKLAPHVLQSLLPILEEPTV